MMSDPLKSIKHQGLHFWLHLEEPLQYPQLSLDQVKHCLGLAALDDSGYLKLSHGGKTPKPFSCFASKVNEKFFQDQTAP